MKPQLKDVTAQDVLSSLFYFHLDSEDDVRFAQGNQTESILEESPEPVTKNKVPLRKPLPPSARSSLEIVHRLEQSLPYPNRDASPEKPEQRPAYASRPVTKRPLGPRPLNSSSHSGGLSVPPEKDPSTYIPRTHGTDPLGPSSSAWQLEPSRVSTTAADKSVHARNSFKTFSITVFRRDPTSGGQWNVAKIIGEPSSGSGEVEQKIGSAKRRPFFTFSISLATPGYNKFQDLPQAGGRSENRDHSHFLPLGYILDHSVGYSINFHRQVNMEWLDRGPKPSPAHNRGLSDAAGALKNLHLKLGNHDSQGFHSDTYNSPKKPKPKGYSFISPWGSRCTFSTSTTGRSLKCTHVLGNPAGEGHTGANSSVLEVSELRFNLPIHGLLKSSTSSYANSAPSDDFSLSRKAHKRSRSTPDIRDGGFSGSHPEMYTSQHSEEERLDLSLGQERAGGGVKGNRAKHGKLIIYDQGFKMLDLVVAANMAIFWSVWKGDEYI